MRKNVKTIETGRGMVSYRISGDREGRALLFLHGAVGDSRLFRHQLKYFGDHLKTIAIDLPGHGRSYNGTVPTLEDYIDAIEAVLDAEQVGSFVCVGHSMGGCVGLEVSRRGLNGLEALVLVSTAPVLPVSEELVNILERDDMSSLADLIVGSVFSNRVDILISFARKGLSEMDPRIIHNDVRICSEMDYRGLLGDISVPVLIIANSGDMVIPSDRTSSMAGMIPGARMVVYDAGGHVPFFEQAAEFNNTLEGFLSDIAELKEFP